MPGCVIFEGEGQQTATQNKQNAKKYVGGGRDEWLGTLSSGVREGRANMQRWCGGCTSWGSRLETSIYRQREDGIDRSHRLELRVGIKGGSAMGKEARQTGLTQGRRQELVRRERDYVRRRIMLVGGCRRGGCSLVGAADQRFGACGWGASARSGCSCGSVCIHGCGRTSRTCCSTGSSSSARKR